MQICQKDANIGERGREMFDSLSIKENNAEYAKKAKQTNRSRRLFEWPSTAPASDFLHTFQVDPQMLEECVRNNPVGCLMTPPSSKGMIQGCLISMEPIRQTESLKGNRSAGSVSSPRSKLHN